jgi:hypothetical protein
MKTKLFIQKKIKNHFILEKLYNSKKFTDDEFLYLFKNNELKMNGIPLRKGGKEKILEKRRILLSNTMFSIVEEEVAKAIKEDFWKDMVEFSLID